MKKILFRRIYYLNSKKFSFEKVKKDLIKEFLKIKPNKYYSIVILIKAGFLDDKITEIYHKNWYYKNPINNQIINEDINFIFDFMSDYTELFSHLVIKNYSIYIRIIEIPWYVYYYSKIKFLIYIFILFIFIYFIYNLHSKLFLFFLYIS